MILAAGYCLYLAGAFALARSKDTFLQGLLFGVAFVLGMAPTLIANAMGSPFATTYGSVDAAAGAECKRPVKLSR
jgi:predicted cobalt transporter CbtA